MLKSEPTLTNGSDESCELNDWGSDWSSLRSAGRTGVDDARSLHFGAAQILTIQDDLGEAGYVSGPGKGRGMISSEG